VPVPPPFSVEGNGAQQAALPANQIRQSTS
jgi:hypothetical protein